MVRAHLFAALSAAVAALLLLLYSVGPVLDHHFAERQPDHTHIYLGTTLPRHVHPYEEPHSHSQEATTSTSHNAASGSNTPQDMVCLTSYDGIGQTLTSPTEAPLHLAIVFPDPGNDQFAVSTAGNDRIPPEAFIAPPKRPPRM